LDDRITFSVDFRPQSAGSAGRQSHIDCCVWHFFRWIASQFTHPYSELDLRGAQMDLLLPPGSLPALESLKLAGMRGIRKG
jgi:hypothetical protein